MGWNAYYKQVAKFVNEHFQKEANALQPQGQPQQRATRLRIVEIGTAFGGNANNLLKTIPHAELCAVDPFLGGYDKNDKTSSRYGRMKSALREAIHASDEHFWPPFSRAYAQGMASNMNGNFGCRYHLLHTTSLLAAGQFNDSSLDVAFIDGLHTYTGVKADVAAWARKVREGGLLLFNDYGAPSFPGVRKAVEEYGKAVKLPVVEGTSAKPPGRENAYIIVRRKIGGGSTFSSLDISLPSTLPA